MRLLFKGGLDGRIVPYQRLPNKMRHGKAGKRYHASQNRVGAAMLDQSRRWGGPITVPFTLSVVLWVPPAGTGLPPGNKGDFDNYVKAVLDAAQHYRVIPGDDLRWYRGPAVLNDEDPVRLGARWAIEWAFFEARPYGVRGESA